MNRPNYYAINAAREEQLRGREASHAQDEVRLAKQIQSHTQCTWTEALKVAYRILTNPK